MTLANQGVGHEADVARRAAQHVREAASGLESMSATEGATIDEVLEAATWAMAAAAVAVAQAKLPAGTTRVKVQ